MSKDSKTMGIATDTMSSTSRKIKNGVYYV